MKSVKAVSLFLCFSFGLSSLGAGLAHAQDMGAATEPEPQAVTPPSAPPADLPPAPPQPPPAPPVQQQGRQDAQQAPPAPGAPPPPAQKQMAPAPQVQVQIAPQPAQPASNGQWVYTEQYGWVWMPYGNQYTYEGTAYGSEPYSYVYYPSYGWMWLASPWVWGWAAYPYFGVVGPWHYGWYRGLRGAGYHWGTYRGGYNAYRARGWGGGYAGGRAFGGGHAY